MNWRSDAIEPGRPMGILSRARRSHDGTVIPRRVGVGGFAASLVLLLALPVSAGDSYPAPGFFAGDLTAQSSWEQILKTPGIQAEFPLLNFGKAFVPVSAVCAEGATLRIADPRIDNGVRVSAASVRGPEQARATMGYAAMRADLFSAPDVRLQRQPDQTRPAPVRYAVSVYKFLPGVLSIQRAFLFSKPWEIPTCPGT